MSLCAVLAASVLSPLGADAVQAQESRQDEEKAGRVDGRGDVLRLYYDEPAPITGIDNPSRDTDTGFEEYSLPLGCGYMGVNVWAGLRQSPSMSQRTAMRIHIRRMTATQIRATVPG